MNSILPFAQTRSLCFWLLLVLTSFVTVAQTPPAAKTATFNLNEQLAVGAKRKQSATVHHEAMRAGQLAYDATARAKLRLRANTEGQEVSLTPCQRKTMLILK